MRNRIWLLLAACILALGAPACGESDDGSAATAAPPPDVVELIDAWYTAAGDGSVADLYLPGGFHLYGDQRYNLDRIQAHLGTPGIGHEWITDTVLVSDNGDGIYVVIRGMRNTGLPVGPVESNISFEIVTTPDGELRLAQTAWFKRTEL